MRTNKDYYSTDSLRQVMIVTLMLKIVPLLCVLSKACCSLTEKRNLIVKMNEPCPFSGLPIMDLVSVSNSDDMNTVPGKRSWRKPRLKLLFHENFVDEMKSELDETSKAARSEGKDRI